MKLPFLWWLPFGKAPTISPEELKSILQDGRRVQVVDARTGMEYRGGTIGDAEHAPLTEMPASMRRLDLDKDKLVVVLCLSGHRSIPGTRWLRARGFEAYSLEGGLLAWKRSGFPLEPSNEQE